MRQDGTDTDGLSRSVRTQQPEAVKIPSTSDTTGFSNKVGEPYGKQFQECSSLDYKGRITLHKAACSGSIDVSECCIDASLNPTVADKHRKLS